MPLEHIVEHLLMVSDNDATEVFSAKQSSSLASLGPFRRQPRSCAPCSPSWASGIPA